MTNRVTTPNELFVQPKTATCATCGYTRTYTGRVEPACYRCLERERRDRDAMVAGYRERRVAEHERQLLVREQALAARERVVDELLAALMPLNVH